MSFLKCIAYFVFGAVLISYCYFVVAAESFSCVLHEDISKENTNSTCGKTLSDPDKTNFYFDFLSDADNCSTYDVILHAKLQKCTFNSVDINIDIADDIHKSECKPSLTSGWKPHSKYFMIGEISSNCSEMKLILSVSGIYSGCYKVTMHPYYLDEEQKNDVFPLIFTKWIENAYSVQHFKPNIIFLSSNLANHVHLQWDLTNFCGDINYNVVQHTLYDNDSLLEDGSNKYPKFKKRSGNHGGCEDITRNCSLIHHEMNHHKINCVLYNLPAEEYDFVLNLLQNPQCIQLDGVLSNCSRSEHFVKEIIPPEKSTKILDVVHMTDVLVLTVVVVVVSICVAIFFIIKRGKRSRPNYTDQDDAESVLSKHRDTDVDGIFLVYARDCQKFMDLMAEFRYILAEATGCKVYDLFDDCQFNTIGQSPEDWIRRMFEYDTVRIVLVATDIGDILYNSTIKYYAQGVYDKIMEPPHFLYKDGDSMDQYVLCAMKHISTYVNLPVTPAPYKKFIVCRISSVTTNMNSFKDIIPFTRFNLPEDLSRLIQKLGNPLRILNNDRVVMDERLRQKFVNSLNILKTYVDANPHYIKETLYNVE